MLIMFSDPDDPDWIIEQAKARKRRELLRNREDLEERLAKIRAKEKSQRERYLKGGQGYKKRRLESDPTAANADDDDEQFVLDDYDSDGEKSARSGLGREGFSAATLELMDKFGLNRQTGADDDLEMDDETKVRHSYTHVVERNLICR